MGAQDTPITRAPERFLKALLDEAAQAYRDVDTEFLDWLGLHPELAAGIAQADRARLARLMRGGACAIAVDLPHLRYSIARQKNEAIVDRQRRELVDAGATWRMLTELGIGLDRTSFQALCSTTPSCYPKGRPPVLSEARVCAMHRYWDACVAPERVDPIDHLLRTADHVNVRVTLVWECLRSHPAAHHGAVAGTPSWVFVMFPEWGSRQQKRSVDRRAS